MNRFEPTFPAGTEAKLHYGDGDFEIVRNGNFVRCAVTDKIIPLDELRYWSVDLQEAYATADIGFKRYSELRSDKN